MYEVFVCKCIGCVGSAFWALGGIWIGEERSVVSSTTMKSSSFVIASISWIAACSSGTQA